MDSQNQDDDRKSVVERTARMSMMLSGPHSARIDTAMTLNDSRVPVIHRTTRASCRGSATRFVRRFNVQHAPAARRPSD